MNSRSTTPATTTERRSLRSRTTLAITAASRPSSAAPQTEPQAAVKRTAAIAANTSAPPASAATGEADVAMPDASDTAGMRETIDLVSPAATPAPAVPPIDVASPTATTDMREEVRSPAPEDSSVPLSLMVSRASEALSEGGK
ncbi:hypothetical protein K438DRAFT_1982371 [Mycena galopus ATCC 62051]|nr:hypothetical protein K438DRAFT_1982371 [Mycena galopus ATCC 62051]